MGREERRIQGLDYWAQGSEDINEQLFDASKLLTLHGEVKSYCFTVSCVPESVFDYLL